MRFKRPAIGLTILAIGYTAISRMHARTPLMVDPDTLHRVATAEPLRYKTGQTLLGSFGSDSFSRSTTNA